jgi:acyl-CoA thioester hydrolase
MKSRKHLELRYSDTDQMGVIYNANYLTYFMQGREQFALDLGFDYLDMEQSGYIFPVREAHVTYLKSIALTDKVYVETSIHELSKIKVVYYHEIKKEDGELMSTGYTTVVCVSKEGIVSRMDRVMNDVYEAYLKAYKKSE